MLDLLRVFELVIDGFDDASFSEHQPVPETDEVVLHVPTYPRNDGDSFL